MESSFKLKNQHVFFYGFLALWLLLNIISASFTGLAHDEAYYWMYSKNLDWGYFDHPPATAVLIKIGTWILNNELGVRIANVISLTAAIFLLWSMCKRYGNDLLLFIILICGTIIFHVYGFIIVPDAPLITSAALYFWTLEKFINNRNRYIIPLSIAVALMIYSKYHGVLILVFTIIAYPQLLKMKSFWLVVLGSFILFLPHILWQINHNYPTLNYHLLNRIKKPYKISHTTNYILGVILITGPLLSFIYWYAVYKVEVSSVWEKILKYNAFGFIIFFFISSFRGKIEPNWNSVIVIPLLILGYKYIKEHKVLRTWAFYLGGTSIFISLVFRFLLANDYLYNKISDLIRVKNEFYNWDQWAANIESVAGDKPVVFINSYQRASKYTFYTGKSAMSYNTINYRANQFDIWDIESELQGKDVLVIYREEEPFLTPLSTIPENLYYAQMDDFRSFKKIHLSNLDEQLVLKSGKKYGMKINLLNGYSFPVNFEQSEALYPEIVVRIYSKNNLVVEDAVKVDKGILEPGESFVQEVHFRTPEEEGKYNLVFALRNKYLQPGQNSQAVKLILQ